MKTQQTVKPRLEATHFIEMWKSEILPDIQVGPLLDISLLMSSLCSSEELSPTIKTISILKIKCKK